MKVKLAYGKSGIEFRIPEHYNVDIIEPRWTPGIKDQAEAVRKALNKPILGKSLKDLCRKKLKVGIVFSDITRATPYNIILPPLIDELSHLDPADITFFCATGTHRPASSTELEKILEKNIIKTYRIVQNECNVKSLFLKAGKTSSGNEIWINKELAECDLKILTGFIEPHFFMGFSGGGEAVMPGMGMLQTIRFNHSIDMLENEGVRWGITDGNPLWEDVQEAAELLTGIFLLNVTLNKEKEITGVFAGDLRSAHREGCIFAKETAMAGVAEPYDMVITSNSGYPLDLNVYQSVKGMSATAQIVKEGGEILVAAECWDGIPEGSDYEKILSSADSIDALYEYIRNNENRLQDTWQVFYQVMIQKKARVSLYTDKLNHMRRSGRPC